LSGYQHTRAAVAESVIGSALLLALLIGLARPAFLRSAALWAQGFAFLGTCVGVFTIMIGVGPQTAADISFHAVLLLILGGGFYVAKTQTSLAV
jgi:hypothetical protein